MIGQSCPRLGPAELLMAHPMIYGILGAKSLEGGEAGLPPLHLVTGIVTTLAQLAALANQAGAQRARIVEAPERYYDVAHFVADPKRARRPLDWGATLSAEDGVRDLVGEFNKRAIRACVERNLRAPDGRRIMTGVLWQWRSQLHAELPGARRPVPLLPSRRHRKTATVSRVVGRLNAWLPPPATLEGP
jgi:hypothetical protein